MEIVLREGGEVVVDGAGRFLESLAKVANDGADVIWRKIKLMPQELVRVLRLDAKRCECFGGKVFEIVRDDQIGAPDDGGGEHVAVLRVRQCETWNQLRAVLDECVAYV